MLVTAGSFNTFPEPLQHNEVKNTANSVAKWVWKNYTKRWTDDEFSQIQAKRGRLGGKAKGDANALKRSEALMMRSKGMSLRAIAKELECSKSVVSNWVSR